MRKAVSAYPGSLTYLDLIRKNRRQSAMLIAVMMAFALLIGAVIGGALGPYFSGLGRVGGSFQRVYDYPASGTPEQQLDRYAATQEQTAEEFRRAPAQVLGADPSVYSDMRTLLPSIAIGAGVAFILASIAAAWSYFSGSSAILALSGARPVHPEEDPVLYNVVDEMRIAAGLPMPRVYIIEDTALNAFATGRDPQHAAVAVTRGLRQTLTRDQLQAVVAHEVAHIRHFDIRFSLLMATMVGLIVVACDAFLRIAFHSGRTGRAFAGGGRSRGGGKQSGGGLAIVLIVVALILSIIAPIIARLIQMAYSRQREYLADAGAVELTRNPQALADALATLANDPDPHVETANRGTAHMFIVNPAGKMALSHQAINSAFSSHPPIKERITRIMALLR